MCLVGSLCSYMKVHDQNAHTPKHVVKKQPTTIVDNGMLGLAVAQLREERAKTAQKCLTHMCLQPWKHCKKSSSVFYACVPSVKGSCKRMWSKVPQPKYTKKHTVATGFKCCGNYCHHTPV